VNLQSGTALSEVGDSEDNFNSRIYMVHSNLRRFGKNPDQTIHVLQKNSNGQNMTAYKTPMLLRSTVDWTKNKPSLDDDYTNPQSETNNSKPVSMKARLKLLESGEGTINDGESFNETDPQVLRESGWKQYQSLKKMSNLDNMIRKSLETPII